MAASGKVTGFSEKGDEGPGIINAGCYVLNAGQLESFNLGEVFSFETDYLALAVLTSCFDLFVSEGRFIDIGVPEDYEKAQIELVILS